MQTVEYLHGSKETLYAKCKQLGLSDEAATNFSYSLYEVALTLEVDEDGDSTIIAVDGKRVVR